MEKWKSINLSHPSVEIPWKTVVSIESPIGKALKGHRVGDRVLVNVNENVSYYLRVKSIDRPEMKVKYPQFLKGQILNQTECGIF